MAILQIKKYPDPILRKKCEEIKEITPEIKRLALDTIETMIQNKGIGLSAPQVGELKRIIVVHLIQERSAEEKAKKRPQVFINPKIVRKNRETAIDEEGCLSFPGLFLKIKRAKGIEIEALDENGNEIRIKAEGLPARVFQHEIDHLNGILFIDHISFWQRFKSKFFK
jgi:peptide deformylase